MNKSYLRNSMKLIGLTLAVIFLVTRCVPGSEKWKEEVQLSTGKVIVIERELELESGGDEWSLNRSGKKPKLHRVKFANPDNSSELIEWHSVKKDISLYPEFPMVLDFEKGQFVIFSGVFNPSGCQLYSKYIYQNGNWIEEKLPAVFVQRVTNLYHFMNEGLTYIDLNKKSESMAGIGARTFIHVGPLQLNCKGL